MPAAVGPRIYNLFPSLLGTVPQWARRLPEVAKMRFNWIFLNPFHATGSSGSLYAVRDYYQLNPMFQGDRQGPPEPLLRRFVQQANEHELSVMMDLVINHTAKDSNLVSEHPEWFVHEEDGSVHSPSVTDLDDPEKVTVWEDLGEIDYRDIKDRDGLLNYWKGVVRHYMDLGFQGFRCDAAYQVPGDVWSEVLEAARAVNPKAMFFAETLGAPMEQMQQLASAGFDYFFNSAKWWDFKEDWLLEQYEELRRIAPSIAFPESHDTPRLAAEKDGDVRHSRFWYLFTAFYSSGVMMPIGYEFGFRKKLDVVHTRPEDWEKPSFDLSSYIQAVNAMKAATPVLNEEGPQERFISKEGPLVGLLRQSSQTAARAAALINPQPDQSQDYPVAQLLEVLAAGREAVQEITPFQSGSLPEENQVRVDPLSIRIFYKRD